MRALTTWQNPPATITLPDAALHIWRIPLLDHDEQSMARSRSLLNAEEMIRANRLIAENPRRCFIKARAALRSILSRYLNVTAADLVFSYGPQGKPVLPHHNISFNLSHSSDLALLAIARRGEIGVDVEVIDPARATGDIAARFFSPAEQEQLQTYSGDERIRAFFRCWSRKESVIKALGEGLLCPLHSFDVDLAEHEARLLAFRRDDIDITSWNMISIKADEQYAAAVTITGACDDVAGFNLT